MKRAARGVVVFLGVAYAAGVVTLAVLWRTVTGPPWWLALSDILAPVWFAPLILLVPLTLLLRSGWLWVASIALLGTFVVLFSSIFMTSEPPLEQANLRLLSFNAGYSGSSSGETVSALLSHEADVVALQELSPSLAESLQQLSDTYPYQSLYPGRAIGLGILSRVPLETAVYDEDIGAQRLQLEVDGKQVALLNVHLPVPFDSTPALERRALLDVLRSYGSGDRAERLTRLQNGMDDISGPLVILGDFNLTPREPAYRRLTGQLQNVYDETTAGFGFTFPNGLALDMPLGSALELPALVRIDHVWVTDDITPINARVDCRDTGSDHCLLRADVLIE